MASEGNLSDPDWLLNYKDTGLALPSLVQTSP